MPDRTPTRRARVLLTVAALLLATGGCTTPPPPVHPLGPDCTWPSDIDIQRDGLAVLLDNGARDVPSAVLLHVATSTIRAKCTGIRWGGFQGRFDTAPDGTRYDDAPGVAVPAISPELHHAVTTAGIIDLTSGQTVPNPAPPWVAIALPGHGTVLRQDATRTDADPAYRYTPDKFCLAPRYDAPQTECRPLTGTGLGMPAVHPDGTVGWAPAVPVPVTFTGPAGETVLGDIQTDGTQVVQARIDRRNPPLRPGSFPHVDRDTVLDHYPLSQRTGLFTHNAANNSTLGQSKLYSSGEFSENDLRFLWYSVDDPTPGAATGTIYAPPTTYQQLAAAIDAPLYRTPCTAIVTDHDRSVVLLYSRENAGPAWAADLVFVRLGLDGTIGPATTLTVGRDRNTSTPPAAYGLSCDMTIYAWPDSSPAAP